MHQRAATADDAHRGGNVEDTGDRCGADFAETVANHRIRLEAARTQPGGVRNRQGHQRRLYDVDAIANEARIGALEVHLLEQRPRRVRTCRRVTRLERGAEHGLVRGKLTRHSDPLRALARHHECHTAGDDIVHDALGRRRCAGGERTQRITQFAGILRDERGAV